MELASSPVAFLQTSLPYLVQLATLALAAVAIVVNRRSSKETVDIQLLQRVWEKRTQTYLDAINLTKRQNPLERPKSDGFKKQLDDGETVDFLAIDIDSEEWREFESRIEAYASEEVGALYSSWHHSLGEWTWTMAKCLFESYEHFPARDEAEAQNDAVLKAVYSAREMLVAQIRAELRFESYRLPPVKSSRVLDLEGIVTHASLGPSGLAVQARLLKPGVQPWTRLAHDAD